MGIAIFFDLDETLCQPELDFGQVFQASCSALFDRTSNVRSSDLLEAWWNVPINQGGLTTFKRLGYAAQFCALTPGVELLQTCVGTLNENWSNVQRLRPGAVEVLQHLERMYPLGIITNGTSDGQRSIIRRLNLARHFQWIFVSGDADIGQWKPQPKIFLHALEKSGTLPSETWYIGDDLRKDIEGASSVGIHSVWVVRSNTTVDCSSTLADLCIFDLKQLLDYVPFRTG